ncbi:hypothetical protein PAMP_022120 [Pampus punctatissimus]
MAVSPPSFKLLLLLQISSLGWLSTPGSAFVMDRDHMTSSGGLAPQAYRLILLSEAVFLATEVVTNVPNSPLQLACAESSLMVAAGICWMGEGGRVEIAKLWEPRQCAEGWEDGKVGKGDSQLDEKLASDRRGRWWGIGDEE